MPFKRVMPVLRGVTQSRWDYVNVRGFGAPTVAPALRLPGDYGPWGLWGMNKRKSVAGLSRLSLATASLLWAGRRQRRRAGIDQPQADRLMALSLALVCRSFLKMTVEFLPA